MPDVSGEFIINDGDNSSKPENKASGVVEKKKAHLLSNLALLPANVSFEAQEANEEIVLLIRHDLVTNVPWIIAAIILAFIPPVVSILSSFFAPFFVRQLADQQKNGGASIQYVWVEKPPFAVSLS